MAKVSDMFTQFINLEVNSDDTDSSDVQKAAVNTGLGYSGDKAMAIHRVEFDVPFFTGTDNVWRMGVMTLSQAGMPEVDDKGCISKLDVGTAFTTSGMAFTKNPIEKEFLPPIIIAAPQLWLYASTYNDEAAYRDKTLKARLHYTFVDITNDLWRELFQTWNTVA